MFIFVRKFIIALIVFLMCGFVYTMIKDNVIPNIKSRIYPDDIFYQITLFHEKDLIKSIITTKEPWMEDYNIFCYRDDYGNIVKLYNFKISVTMVKNGNSW